MMSKCYVQCNQTCLYINHECNFWKTERQNILNTWTIHDKYHEEWNHVHDSKKFSLYIHFFKIITGRLDNKYGKILFFERNSSLLSRRPIVWKHYRVLNLKLPWFFVEVIAGKKNSLNSKFCIYVHKLYRFV